MLAVSFAILWPKGSIALAQGIPQGAASASMEIVSTNSAANKEALAETAPEWLPVTAATLEVIPGAGHLLLGDLQGAGLALGSVAAPLALGLLNTPPMLYLDQNNPEKGASAFDPICNTAQFLSIYHVYQEGRDRRDAGSARPRAASISDLIWAPFQSEQLLDWRVWSAVAFSFLASKIAVTAQPYAAAPATPASPLVFQAQSATLLGAQVPSALGYGANLVGSAYIGANAGIGEEALFRGVMQTELERSLGPWAGLILTSSLFGLAHVGGLNKGNALSVFLGTGLVGFIDGRLYQVADHDLKKSVAAHAYYDFLVFALMNLHPTLGGNNTLGLHYQF